MLNYAFIKEVGPVKWVYRFGIRQFYKRIAKCEHVMRLPTGESLTLPISNRFASEAFITGGDVDWGSEKLFHELLKGQGAFLDIGAHIGYYSLYMLPRVTMAYCFEPDPRVRPFLERNVAAKPNVRVVPCAVAEQRGTARFTLESNAEVSHLSRSDETGKTYIDVDVVTVDSFVAENSLAVEAIKIDVEGFDTAVIAGALGLLREQQPLVITEAKPDAVLFDVIHDLPYRVFAYVREPRTRAKQFVELVSAADAPARGDTKMLFLVPPRLSDEILEKARV